MLYVCAACPACCHCRSCLSQPGETVRSQVLESLGCWLKLSGGSDLPQGMASSQLVTAALDGLAVDGTFDAAVDAVSCDDVLVVCALSSLVDGMAGGGDSSKACSWQPAEVQQL
jgi:hypothetical protein